RGVRGGHGEGTARPRAAPDVAQRAAAEWRNPVIDRVRLAKRLEAKEGRRKTVYKDAEGIETIGVGRNLRDKGLNDREIDLLLSNDIDAATADSARFTWFGELDQVRQHVIVEMVFNLGFARLQGFKEMLLATASGQYAKASNEMLDSLWAKQVGQ